MMLENQCRTLLRKPIISSPDDSIVRESKALEIFKRKIGHDIYTMEYILFVVVGVLSQYTDPL